MKRLLLVIMTLSLLLSLAYAKEMQAGTNLKPLDTPQGIRMPSTRDVPAYTFTRLPTGIIVNYYDYMIGSYNGLPLRVIPSSAGGGYFMTYHGRRQPTSTRRAFYTYLDAQGNVVSNNEITSVQNTRAIPPFPWTPSPESPCMPGMPMPMPMPSMKSSLSAMPSWLDLPDCGTTSRSWRTVLSPLPPPVE